MPAVGAAGLAAGVVGTYLEQRDANRRQAGQFAAAEVTDIAQVRPHPQTSRPNVNTASRYA
jgi:hypothetical protein